MPDDISLGNISEYEHSVTGMWAEMAESRDASTRSDWKTARSGVYELRYYQPTCVLSYLTYYKFFIGICRSLSKEATCRHQDVSNNNVRVSP
jgi:hypothetical protein